MDGCSNFYFPKSQHRNRLMSDMFTEHSTAKHLGSYRTEGEKDCFTGISPNLKMSAYQLFNKISPFTVCHKPEGGLLKRMFADPVVPTESNRLDKQFSMEGSKLSQDHRVTSLCNLGKESFSHPNMVTSQS